MMLMPKTSWPKTVNGLSAIANLRLKACLAHKSSNTIDAAGVGLMMDARPDPTGLTA